jgi:Helix-turn-helix domain
MADVWDFGPEDATLTNVLVVLANSADDNGANCFPGTALIAQRTRLSERTVIRAIAELELQGWITVLQRGSGRPKRGNRWQKAASMSQYLINVERLKGCHSVTLSKKGKRVTPKPKRVTLTPEKGDTDDNPPHPLIGVSVKEPSVPQVLPPNPPRAGGDGLGKSHPAASTPKSKSLQSRDAAAERALDAAADALMNGMAITDDRVRPKLRRAVAMEGDKGESPPATVLAMLHSWREQKRNSALLKVKYGPVKFIVMGIWRDQDAWHWDEREVRLAREAKGGR